jgi:hypothetical protein
LKAEAGDLVSDKHCGEKAEVINGFFKGLTPVQPQTLSNKEDYVHKSIHIVFCNNKSDQV